MFDSGALTQARYAGAGGGMRMLRRIVVLAFAVIQATLIGRILLDLGVIPAEGLALEYLVPWSDALAAPVRGVGDALGGVLGGGGLPGAGVPGLGPSLGSGLNPAMVAALGGWTVVEWLVMRVVRKLATA